MASKIAEHKGQSTQHTQDVHKQSGNQNTNLDEKPEQANNFELEMAGAKRMAGVMTMCATKTCCHPLQTTKKNRSMKSIKKEKTKKTLTKKQGKKTETNTDTQTLTR